MDLMHTDRVRRQICLRECAVGKGKKVMGVGEVSKNTNHNDSDSLPTVEYSIQYSWKYDTFLLQWMALTLKPILSTSVIEFLKKLIWLQGHSFAM